MEIWQALVLGIAQGLSEFLPVSSSGHLLLLEKLGIGQENLFFNVTLHVGTLFAVLLALRKTWIPLIAQPFFELAKKRKSPKKQPFSQKNRLFHNPTDKTTKTHLFKRGRKAENRSIENGANRSISKSEIRNMAKGASPTSEDTRLAGDGTRLAVKGETEYEYQSVFGGLSASKIDGFVVLACVPTVAIALVFKLLAPTLLEGKLLGCGFVLTAVLMYVGENFKSTQSTLLTHKTSILTGVLQGIAVLPGVSRSGATISILSFLGVEKKTATTFSFLLSIPIIVGSALYESLDLFLGKAPLSISPWAIVVGVFSSFLSGLFAIKFFLKLIEKHSLWGFVLYTLLLGICVSILPFFI